MIDQQNTRDAGVPRDAGLLRTAVSLPATMSASNRYVGLMLATASGCLWFLACPPFDFAGLAWFAAVPMLLAIDRAPTWRQAVLLGGWAGAVETGGGFYWLIDLMQRFGGFPWLGAVAVFVLFCATRACIFLIFAGLVCAIRRNHRVPMTLLAPLVMVVGELIVPQLFPCGQWISQAWHPLVIQITELTGPLGVTALLMLVNGALYDLIARETFARTSAIAAVVAVAAALGFGAIRMRQVDALVAASPRLAVGLVQPNFAYPVDGQLTREEALRQLTALQEQSARLERAGARLIVWSEGAYPVMLPRDFPEDFPAGSLGRIRRGFSAPVVIGADTLEADQEDPYNSALLFDGDGKAVGRYDKVRLLAFGEYMPGIETFPWLRKVLPEGTGRFKRGAGPGVMSLAQPDGTPWRLGPLICYEDLLPGFIRGVGRLHPNLLVNLTSDSWFGARTEPFEHLALAVFATIEVRVSLVRAVNSGISALIDPNGRLVSKTYADDPYREPHATDGLLVSAPKMEGGHTLFVAWGNWFAYTCLAATLALLFGAQLRRDSRRP
jgi:apolipoprotein N-acyltransferase